MRTMPASAQPATQKNLGCRPLAARTTSHAILVSLDQTGTSRPPVFGTEHGHRYLGGVRVRRNAVIEEVLGGLLDFDVACKRGDDGLVYALGAHFLDHLDHGPGEHHGGRD